MLTKEKGKEACAHARQQHALPGRSLLHLLLHELFQALPLQLHLSLETLSFYVGPPVAPVVLVSVVAEDSVPLPAECLRVRSCMHVAVDAEAKIDRQHSNIATMQAVVVSSPPSGVTLQAQHTWVQAARIECGSWGSMCAASAVSKDTLNAFLRKKPLLTTYFLCLCAHKWQGKTSCQPCF